ncbi:hypothetical protein Nepgr_033543 [Nepenthes gracilis]|uniref:Uncharacterized protein n=1 Tax=Nepenthes gracilis TaxID=150966 RepID=A0AAD3TM86_NEPGR|nr:hypothetical protein Nepgr_033543 [Nepenthes gracilis]
MPHAPLFHRDGSQDDGVLFGSMNDEHANPLKQPRIHPFEDESKGAITFYVLRVEFVLNPRHHNQIDGSSGEAISDEFGLIPGVDVSTPESIVRIARKYSPVDVVDGLLNKAPSTFKMSPDPLVLLPRLRARGFSGQAKCDPVNWADLEVDMHFLHGLSYAAQQQPPDGFCPGELLAVLFWMPIGWYSRNAPIFIRHVALRLPVLQRSLPGNVAASAGFVALQSFRFSHLPSGASCPLDRAVVFVLPVCHIASRDIAHGCFLHPVISRDSRGELSSLPKMNMACQYCEMPHRTRAVGLVSEEPFGLLIEGLCVLVGLCCCFLLSLHFGMSTAEVGIPVMAVALQSVPKFGAFVNYAMHDAVVEILIHNLGIWACRSYLLLPRSWQEALRDYREQGRSNNLEIGTRQPRNSIKGDINSSSLEASLGRNEARQPAFHAKMPRHVSTSDNPIKKQRE